MTTTSTAPANPFTPSGQARPVPDLHAAARDAPVHPLLLPDGRQLWLVTRHDDVERALCDPPLVRTGLPEEHRPMVPTSMLALDPPDHTRLRALVRQAFTSRPDLRPAVRLDALRWRPSLSIRGLCSFPVLF